MHNKNQFSVIDSTTGECIEEVDETRVQYILHDGAIYLRQGVSNSEFLYYKSKESYEDLSASTSIKKKKETSISFI